MGSLETGQGWSRESQAGKMRTGQISGTAREVGQEASSEGEVLLEVWQGAGKGGTSQEDGQEDGGEGRTPLGASGEGSVPLEAGAKAESLW